MEIQEKNSTVNNVDISKINALIEKESGFIDLLNMEIGKVIIGQKHMVESLLIGLLSNGHILLEGVPGLAKTLAISTLSKVINVDFKRVQFTPDLLPADLLGTMIYNQKKEEFISKKGPLFSNFILADEINRAPAKVQSALLEAMQERQITIGDKTYKLPEPFLVMATQNPIEQEGTYPLPEAQLDRFMFQLWVDYPTFDQEKQIITQTTSTTTPTPRPQMNKADILEYQQLIREVPIPSSVLDFTVFLVSSTRPGASDNKSDKHSIANEFLSWGAGPRASQNLIIAAKTKALSEGRFNITEDEILKLFFNTEYFCYMTGFIAGMPFLGDINKKIRCDRLETPRVKVPKGSIGLTEQFANVYTFESPGGWNIIGNTPLEIFDISKTENPNLISPGDTVIFKQISLEDYNNYNE